MGDFALKEAGVRAIGENRVQEILKKYPDISADFSIHLIGQLQTNKINYIIGKVCMVQSLDRPRLAQALDAAAQRAGRRLSVLLEVNIGGEAQKAASGRRVPRRSRQCAKLPAFAQGLMTVLPASDDFGVAPVVSRMRALFERLRAQAIDGVQMAELSMACRAIGASPQKARRCCASGRQSSGKGQGPERSRIKEDNDGAFGSIRKCRVYIVMPRMGCRRSTGKPVPGVSVNRPGFQYNRIAKPKAAPTRRPIEEPTPIQSLFGRRPAQDPRHAQRMDNVIRMPEREERASSFSSAPALERAVGQGKTIIFCVRRKDDSSQIITYLLSGINVILNFEEIDDAQCQRVLDMVSGAAFALSGTVERISHRNYLVAPTGVEIVRSEAELRGDRDRMFLAR